METLLVCGNCEGIIRNLYTQNWRCSNCGLIKGSLKAIVDLKCFLGGNYYWYDSIRTLLGKDFDKYIDGFGKDGIIFTKNKYRGSTPSRQWRIKKWSRKTIELNESIEPYSLEFIAKGIPLNFEQSYLLIKGYLGGEEKVYRKTSLDNKGGQKYLDKNLVSSLKYMCNKYLRVLNGELTYDDDEAFVLFTMENKIERNILLGIMGNKRILEGKYNNILVIYDKYKKLS